MDIRNTKELSAFATRRLEGTPKAQQIVGIFGLIAIGSAALVTIINYVLGLQISGLGGLGNMGTRSFLSTLQTVLPLVQSMALVCLDVGYLSAMLRVARGQYASPNGLRLGFDRFWSVLRCTLSTTLIYVGAGFGAIYLSTILFTLTPLYRPVAEILEPIVSQTSILDSGIFLDEATYARLLSSMTPFFIIVALVCLLLIGPIFYSYRMVNYILIDKPGMSTLAILWESRKMMRGHRLSLLKLDLRLWWYHAAMALASVVCYGDTLVPMLGITLPWSEDVSYFLFFGLYLAVQFAIYYFLRNRVDVAYALAYDAIRPEEKKDEGVVLGNIFQM